jgi:glucose-1-phosphate thymidylyltransferase
VFYGGDTFADRPSCEFREGATIFGYHVQDPERYGVVEFDDDRQARILDRGKAEASPRAATRCPGLYLYDNEVVSIAKALKPSARGEFEITDVNLEYLRRGTLAVQQAGPRVCLARCRHQHEPCTRPVAYVQTIEKRQGIKIGCPEEAAFRRGFINATQLESLVATLPKCEYRAYLEEVVAEDRRLQTR